MSTIVLNTRNYIGTGILNGVSYFWDKAAGLVSQFSSLTNRLNFGPTKTTVGWKLVEPVHLEPTEGCCTATDLEDTIVDVTIRFDRRIPSANRTATLLRVQDLVQSVQFEDSVTNLTQAQ